jgi:ribose transport system substrate-binding protein
MKSIVSGRKRAAVWLALLLLSVCALGGCRKEGGGSTAGGGGTGGGGGKKVVGFSQMEMDGPWRIAETESMRAEAAKHADKYDFRLTVAQGDTAKQAANVEDLVAQRVDAIFLAPREKVGFEQTLQTAKEAGIPVILVDREAAGTAGEDFVTVLKSDFIEQGRRAAEWLARASNGKASIVELSGTTGASVTQDRAKGFRRRDRETPGDEDHSITDRRLQPRQSARRDAEHHSGQRQRDHRRLRAQRRDGARRNSGARSGRNEAGHGSFDRLG